MDRGHEEDAPKKVVGEEGAHEVHPEGEDAGEAHPSTLRTTIASPRSI